MINLAGIQLFNIGMFHTNRNILDVWKHFGSDVDPHSHYGGGRAPWSMSSRVQGILLSFTENTILVSQETISNNRQQRFYNIHTAITNGLIET